MLFSDGICNYFHKSFQKNNDFSIDKKHYVLRFAASTLRQTRREDIYDGFEIFENYI